MIALAPGHSVEALHKSESYPTVQSNVTSEPLRKGSQSMTYRAIWVMI